MEQAILLHNPGAGDEDHVQSDLVSSIEEEGYGCVYFSIKKDSSWKQQLDQADFAVVAGGDGTVRRVVKELVKRNVLDKKIPLAVLPMGTANNLSKTLGLNRNQDRQSLIRNWKTSHIQRFDVGVIKNAESTDFFLEGAGYGAFPKLIKKMETADKSNVKTASDELQLALRVFREIVLSSKPKRYWIKADENIYEGKCLLLEVMNIQSIGPNLVLAPEAEIDDGFFNVVCVEEDQREDFLRYIDCLINGGHTTFKYTAFKAKELTIDCESKHMHVDDELILPFKNPLVLEVREHVVEFLISK